MMRTKQILATFALGCMLATLPACSGNQKTKNDIMMVSLGYLKIIGNNKKPPADAKEYSEWAIEGTDEAASLTRLESQGYKVYWGTDPGKLPAPGAGGTVLIYPGDAATKGGLVGMADGTVKTMTADEFIAAAKPPAAK